MSSRILIAGVGNIFFGDDGYGCEVIRQLAGERFPQGVRVEDYGIRGTHLAFELMSGYEGAILIDAVPRGGDPGTLYVIEPDVEHASGTPDAHSMNLQQVFAFMNTLEGRAPRIVILGCEPGPQREGMALSLAVERAARESVAAVHATLQEYFLIAAEPAGSRS